ncbi:MAG: alpha-glucan family phosphorylase, partial [Pseudomonadota bacterium]
MSIRKYVVVPPVKGGLEDLRDLAGNLWFSWNPEAAELFDHLDPALWEGSFHNPQHVLIRLSKSRLAQVGSDEGYQSFAERVRDRFNQYMERSEAYDFNLDQAIDFTTAYFSLEFGITECLSIYSGGLGLLAGDHLKSASDLNVPLTAVGLMYHEGYFHQRLSLDDWQNELYPRSELDILPLEKLTDKDGNPLRISVDLAGDTCWLRVLRANVGRVPLYLLDADIPENNAEFRKLTLRLYGGDQEMRIRQEMLLGIGGCRALDALGIKPLVYHLNEGHVTFTLLERIRHFIEDEGLSLAEAREIVMGQSVLTVHTPVPAGNEVFPQWLMEKYFSGFAARLGMDFQGFTALGRKNPTDVSEGFCMPVLGLHLTAKAN